MLGILTPGRRAPGTFQDPSRTLYIHSGIERSTQPIAEIASIRLESEPAKKRSVLMRDLNSDNDEFHSIRVELRLSTFAQHDSKPAAHATS